MEASMTNENAQEKPAQQQAQPEKAAQQQKPGQQHAGQPEKSGQQAVQQAQVPAAKPAN